MHFRYMYGNVGAQSAFAPVCPKNEPSGPIPGPLLWQTAAQSVILDKKPCRPRWHRKGIGTL